MEKKYSFGKKAVKFDPKTLRMAKYTIALPDPPKDFDNIKMVGDNLALPVEQLFPIDGNDRYGDCVVAGMAHYLTLSNGRIGELQIPTEKEVLKFYLRRTWGRDTGLVMLDTLKYWRKHRFYNHHIIAFGRIDVHDHKLVKQCIQLFGGVDLGFLVQRDAIPDFDSGTTFDTRNPWTPGPTDGGGHCVVAAGFDELYYYILTWGGLIKATKEWWDAQVDEAYAILPPEAQDPKFAPGFDFETLQADLLAVTT